MQINSVFCIYISLANKPFTVGMKFYKVEQQSFVYKEARYKRNDKFKLNLTPSIYNKCRDYCPQQANRQEHTMINNCRLFEGRGDIEISYN